MTPEELNEFLVTEELPPSVIAFSAGLDRSRIRAYLAGDVEALLEAERSTLREKVIVPEHKRSANVQEQSAVIDGAGEFLRKHSVLFHYEKGGARQTASGSLVEIGGKLFVATARHTIPNGTQMLEFVGANVTYIEASEEKVPGKRDWKGRADIKVLKGGRHERLDVGFIEIDPFALNVLKHESISLSSVSVGAQQYGRTAFVFGYPFELERIGKLSETERILHAMSLTYSNPVLAPEEWPEVPSDDRQPEEHIDCLMRYSRDDQFKSIVPIGRNRNYHSVQLPELLPAVFGMSGGGFWQRWTPIADSQLWLACDYKLFAIQSSWSERGQYIRGIQIRHWLDLVSESYPELKPLIDEHVVAQSNLAG
ncbi:MAG TPA: hypothetical protein PLY87_11680 [Planctomycetaceae bacterium]|nr:hypothetical protein [Planctomycetaceae bacterium]